MKLAIASGKGGTGKTTVALCLAWASQDPVCYADCDVEAPNGHLFLRPRIQTREESRMMVPRVDESVCTFCGKCAEACRFNALAVLPGSVMIFDELCHGCGGCVMACPERAIREETRTIGIVEKGFSDEIAFISGKLNVGEAMSPPLIRAVKKSLPANRICIIDAPPGTSCPMIAAVRDADACLLVTEPTPFGLNDLKLAVETVRALEIPFGVVINRDGIGDSRVEDSCRGEGITVVARIPENRDIAEAYAKGRIAVDAVPDLAPLFLKIWGFARNLAGYQKAVSL